MWKIVKIDIQKWESPYHNDTFPIGRTNKLLGLRVLLRIFTAVRNGQWFIYLLFRCWVLCCWNQKSCEIFPTLCLHRVTTFHCLGKNCRELEAGQPRGLDWKNQEKLDFTVQTYKLLYTTINSIISALAEKCHESCFQTLHMRPNQEWVARVRMFHPTYLQGLERSNAQSPCFK